MKRLKSLAFAALVAAAALPAAAADFHLSSPDIAAGQSMAAPFVMNGFGCTGGNLSPALTWDNPPPGTASFAITVYDPDAPTGSGWWHWVVYNLPASTRGLERGAPLPAGAVTGRTDYGTPGYGGPCPPAGDPPHRYQFTVHALKVDKVDLPADASAAMVGFMLHANRLGSATLEAYYGR